MRLFLFLVFASGTCLSQPFSPHPNAHAHNDYEHKRPLKDALKNGFVSVEADVHLRKEYLLVAHNFASDNSPTLEKLYLFVLDSLLNANKGQVYPGAGGPFYLMIDIKTDGEETYAAIRRLLVKYPSLRCKSKDCPVRIFLSGERPASTMIDEGYSGLGIDGRPEDLGKGYSTELMPVVSDTYRNWSKWNGESKLTETDLQRVKDLASRVHAEGKKLRLWAIPDNEGAWDALLKAGVDFINTDHLEKLNAFLTRKGL